MQDRIGNPMKDTVPAQTSIAASDLVVVLLATFNGSRYLRQQLDSIAAQSHKRWRLVVADDGSLDDTLDVVRSFSKEQPGRVRVVEGDRVGSARDNFFRLLRVAGPAPYFAFCDQDDVWSNDKLERLVRECQDTSTDDSPCMVYSDLAVVDEHLGLLNSSFLQQIRARPYQISHKNLLAENAIPGCAMLFNSTLAEIFLAREFNQASAIMHDWWIALLASTVGRISYVPVPLVNYRQHATNTLGTVDRSGLKFALTKLFGGDRSNSVRTYIQAAEFLQAYGDLLEFSVQKDIHLFASLDHRHKFARILLILKHRMLKQTLARRVYQVLRA